MERKSNTQVLIEKAQQGDQHAFDALTRENYERVKGLVLRLQGANLRIASAEDVLQETFLRAYQHFARFQWQGEDSLFRWLGGIAANVIRELDKEGKGSPLIGLSREHPGKGVSQSKVIRREERFSRFKASLGSLSAEHREVIQLARFEGLPLKEVARRMNRSHDAIRQLLVRALQKLKTDFGDTESLHLPKKSPDENGEADG